LAGRAAGVAVGSAVIPSGVAAAFAGFALASGGSEAAGFAFGAGVFAVAAFAGFALASGGTEAAGFAFGAGVFAAEVFAAGVFAGTVFAGTVFALGSSAALRLAVEGLAFSANTRSTSASSTLEALLLTSRPPA
jgi:hypothetical protein